MVPTDLWNSDAGYSALSQEHKTQETLSTWLLWGVGVSGSGLNLVSTVVPFGVTQVQKQPYNLTFLLILAEASGRSSCLRILRLGGQSVSSLSCCCFSVFPTVISHHSRVLLCQPDFFVVPFFLVIICWFPYVWKIHSKWLMGKMYSSALNINSPPHPTPPLSWFFKRFTFTKIQMKFSTLLKPAGHTWL